MPRSAFRSIDCSPCGQVQALTLSLRERRRERPYTYTHTYRNPLNLKHRWKRVARTKELTFTMLSAARSNNQSNMTIRTDLTTQARFPLMWEATQAPGGVGGEMVATSGDYPWSDVFITLIFTRQPVRGRTCGTGVYPVFTAKTTKSLVASAKLPLRPNWFPGAGRRNERGRQRQKVFEKK